MRSIHRNLYYVGLVCLTLVIASHSVSAKTTVSKVKSEKVSPSPVSSGNNGENILMRLARSLAVEALGEFKESARRNPKLGFNFTMPVLIPGLLNGTDGLQNFTGLPGFAELPMSIGLSALSLKSGLIAVLAGLKFLPVSILLTVLTIAFLLSGTAFFVCSLGIVSCGSALGGIGGGIGEIGGGGGGGYGKGSSTGYSPSSSSGGGIGSSFTSLFNSRAGLAEQYERATQPVYKALDEGYKKYQ